MKDLKQFGCSARNNLLRRFPRFSLRALAILSHLRHQLTTRARRDLESNLRLAFPGKTSRGIRQLARRVLVTNLVEGAAQYRLSLLAKEALCKEMMAMSITGFEHLERAMAAGQGVVLVTPHYGDFMQAALRVALTQFGKPVYFFYNPSERNPYANTSDALIDRVGDHCVKIHHDKKGVITALRALKNGAILCFMPDQITPEGEPIYVPFFGKFFGVMKGAAFFALKGNAQIVPVYCTAAAGRQTLEYRPPLEIGEDRSLDEEGRLYQISAALFKETERQFRQAPTHWRYWTQFQGRCFTSPTPPKSHQEIATQLEEVRRRVSGSASASEVINDWQNLLRSPEATLAS